MLAPTVVLTKLLMRAAKFSVNICAEIVRSEHAGWVYRTGMLMIKAGSAGFYFGGDAYIHMDQKFACKIIAARFGHKSGGSTPSQS